MGYVHTWCNLAAAAALSVLVHDVYQLPIGCADATALVRTLVREVEMMISSIAKMNGDMVE